MDSSHSGVAEQMVRPITGVRDGTDRITLKTTCTPSNLAGRMEQALGHQAERETKAIEVTANGASATLCGQVHSTRPPTTTPQPGARRAQPPARCE